MKIKPAPGLKVRDPKTKQLIPETGVEIGEPSSFWIRRLQDGDVVEVKDSSPAKKDEPKTGGKA